MKYEEAIKNLESIVSMMESGKLDLDQLEEKLKEAQQLIKLCRDKLTKTDEEISKLLQQYGVFPFSQLFCPVSNHKPF